METRKKRPYNSTNRRSGNKSGRSAAGKTTAQSKGSSSAKHSSVLYALRIHPIGRVILITICAACVVGLDFLITLNSFNRFFLVLGVELIILVLFCWIRFVIRGHSDDND